MERAFWMKFNAISKYFEPFSRGEHNQERHKDLSLTLPELVVSPKFVNKMSFRKFKTVYDTLKLLRVLGTGRHMELAFRNMTDAKTFAVLLYKLNKKITIEDQDR